MKNWRKWIVAILFLLNASAVIAQDLRVVTVTRTPFSMEVDGVDTGFSIDLLTEIAAELNRDFEIQRLDSFTAMLEAVQTGSADIGAANISITAARETAMDFSQPIFRAGLRVMVPLEQGGSSVLQAIWNRDFLLAALVAFAVLAAGGMVMWWLERKNGQEYFQGSAREKAFPSFWWALNVVVNGGFEQLVPRTILGRLFGTVLVLSSLFIVSIFVAHITAAATVTAIQSSVTNVNDLYDKRVGTIAGSTAADFMDTRDIRHSSYPDLDGLLAAFEDKDIEAVVFDAPILAYYVNTDGKELAELVGPIFLAEDYGFALPSDSTLREPINRALLKLREDGTYERLRQKWFGN